MTVPGMLTPSELRSAVDSGEIDTIVTAFPDLYGRLVGKRITGHFFVNEVMGDGIHACDYLLACDMEMDPTPGYAYTSWETGYGDLHAVPDMSTLRRVSWHEKTALVLCDCVESDGTPVPVSPRGVLKQQLARAADAGFSVRTGNELEFFLFRDDYDSANAKDYRNLASSQHYIEDYHVLSGTFAEPVIGAIRRGMDASGVPVEFSKGEWGPGQHEINLRYAEALEMADRHVIYKLGAKEIAAQQGHSLTFMAKWAQEMAGNSLHIHASLWRPDGSAVFGEPGETLPGTSAKGPAVFRHWLGGLLAHARELSLFFAPTVNSYKRYQPGTFAPTAIAWSWDNRTAGLRVVGQGDALRAECRIPGADANPYLAAAAIVAAGLDGISRELEPEPAFEGDVYAAEGLTQVPHRMADAIAELEASTFAREAFGDLLIDHFLHFARTELGQHESAVTDWERRRYFERV